MKLDLSLSCLVFPRSLYMDCECLLCAKQAELWVWPSLPERPWINLSMWPGVCSCSWRAASYINPSVKDRRLGFWSQWTLPLLFTFSNTNTSAWTPMWLSRERSRCRSKGSLCVSAALSHILNLSLGWDLGLNVQLNWACVFPLCLRALEESLNQVICNGHLQLALFSQLAREGCIPAYNLQMQLLSHGFSSSRLDG